MAKIKIDKRIALIAGILIIVLAVGYGLNKAKAIKEINIAVENLITAICTNELGDYTTFAAGDTLYKLHNNKNIATAEIEALQVMLSEYNKNYAEVSCQIDLKLADGSYDVSWYDMELVNKDGWKVYKVELAEPIHTSYLFKTNQDNGMFEHVFKEYIKTQNIKQYTAGELRQNLERTESERIGDISNLEMTYLYGDNKLVKYDVSYAVDGRQVDNIITFYKTKEGWKMVDVESSFIKEE